MSERGEAAFPGLLHDNRPVGVRHLGKPGEHGNASVVGALQGTLFAAQGRINRQAPAQHLADALRVRVIQQSPIAVGDEGKGAFAMKVAADDRMKCALLEQVDGAADRAEEFSRRIENRL
ncbi:hypothetical protein D3C76_1115010 [compost metagenome]